MLRESMRTEGVIAFVRRELPMWSVLRMNGIYNRSGAETQANSASCMEDDIKEPLQIRCNRD
jgi:hypothetical protein